MPSGTLCSPGLGRQRLYHETRNLLDGARWRADEPVPWVGADALDPPAACWYSLSTTSSKVGGMEPSVDHGPAVSQLCESSQTRFHLRR